RRHASRESPRFLREDVRDRRIESPLLLRRLDRARRRTARVEIVPIQDRIEAEEEVPLRLPPPVGPVGEHDEVSLAEGRVDDDGLAGERLPADEDAGEQHVVRIGGKREQDARRRSAGTAAAAGAAAKSATSAAAAATTA